MVRAEGGSGALVSGAWSGGHGEGREAIEGMSMDGILSKLPPGA